MQLKFIKWLFPLSFLLLAADTRERWPDRVPSPASEVDLHYSAITIPPGAGRLQITGAWRVEAADPRFAGLSALAALPGRPLLALTDSGVLIDLPRPGTAGQARLRDLPAGPGPATFRRYRDSEAMLVDPDGLGSWITFENQHSLWRFERDGGSFAYALPSRGWRVNKGIEAMVVEGGTGALLLLSEEGRRLWRFEGPGGRALPLSGATGGIADAVRLPDGRMVVAVREVGLGGLTNRLAWLERDGTGYRLRNFATLPLGMIDNVEGLAAEPGPNGRTILWAVTDNDGWRRTVLLRLELDTTKAPAKAGASNR